MVYKYYKISAENNSGILFMYKHNNNPFTE